LGGLTSIPASLNTDVASQLTLLPFVAPASGISLTFDRSLGVFSVSQDSFAPILSERAVTIGKHRLAIGFSYQYLNFDSLDGTDLHNLPTLNLRGDEPGVQASQGVTCSVNGGVTSPQNTLACGLVRDYITAQNRIDLRINQYTTFVTFGLTSRVDVSVAIPVLSIRMAMTSNATITENSNSSSTLFLKPAQGCTGPAIGEPIPNSQVPATCFQEVFSNAHQSGGLGDITIRAKGTLWKGERVGIAAGMDLRIPSGDELNFLGSGAYGVKPFVVLSYGGRVSPHLNFGYQWNGDSKLAGDFSSGTRAQLPGQLLYSAGVEVGVSKRLTAAFDLIGQRVFDAKRISLSRTTVLGFCDTPAVQDASGWRGCQFPGQSTQVTAITTSSGSYGIHNASLGLRYRPFGKFLITASVQLKLDNGGLRSNAIPMVSATYTFR
jgi:hypothetical protein